jgi:hypothetical protein
MRGRGMTCFFLCDEKGAGRMWSITTSLYLSLQFALAGADGERGA